MQGLALKKVCCHVGGKVDHENLISNKLIRVTWLIKGLSSKCQLSYLIKFFDTKVWGIFIQSVKTECSVLPKF